MTIVLLAALIAAAPAEKPLPRRADPAAAAPAPSTAAAPSTGAAEAPAAAPREPLALATSDDARKACEQLAPEDRLAAQGGAIERGEAAAKHEAARAQALDARYRLAVPSERLRFGPYSSEEGVLSLYRHLLPATADGSVRLNLAEDHGLPVQVDPAVARRILAAHAQKKLSLNVTFVAAEDEEAPCFHVPGTPTYTFAAEPIAWEYVADGAVLARGGQGADLPLISAREGAKPRVQVGKPLQEGEAEAKELGAVARDRIGEVEACYSSALNRDPLLDGAVVADLQLSGRRGSPERVRIAADTVGDEQLVSCVRDVLASLDVRGGGRAFLPIHFTLEPPRQQTEN